MPILTMQRSMRQLGRIRMGNQVPAGDSGKLRPAKLSNWRLTSPFRDSLDVAAQLYGGEVREWQGAPAGTGQQWELYTESRSLEILVPVADMAFSQWFEMWSGGGCQRRCDGRTETLSDGPCQCPNDVEARMEQANKGKACKPTTRLSVVQPSLPDIGLWRLDTHGYYGTTELAGTISVLEQVRATTGMVPARLTIDQRSVKRDGKTNNFAVPVIELPTLNIHALATGDAGRAELANAKAEIAAAPGEEPAAPVTIAQATEQPVEKPRAQPKAAEDRPDGEPTNGAVFRRNLRNAMKRHGIDEEQGDSIAMDTVGKPVREIATPFEGNATLEAFSKWAAANKAEAK